MSLQIDELDNDKWVFDDATVERAVTKLDLHVDRVISF